MSLLDIMFSAKPSPGNPCLIEQPRFRITLPAGWTVMSPRDWRGRFVAKGPSTQSIEGQFNETSKSRRKPMSQEMIRKVIDHHRKQETAKNAQVQEESRPNEMTYLEAVVGSDTKTDAHFVFLGPTCMLDAQARELRAPMDLESIRRCLKAIEWR